MPPTLEGRLARLEPLTLDHVDALCRVGLDPAIWEWNPFDVSSRDEMLRYVRTALSWQEAGTAIPFATIAKATGTVVGSTRFGAIDRFNRHVEIGWTWLGTEWWRTGINTEVKLLQLTHAFELWNCYRVEFKTDALNARSRVAIERIGAKFEGTFRNHMVTSTDRLRDSAYYSIVATEWPSAKSALEARLAMHGGTA